MKKHTSPTAYLKSKKTKEDQMFRLKSSFKLFHICFVSQGFAFCSESKDQEIHQEVIQVASRLKRCMLESERKCRKNRDGVDICTLKYQKYGWSGYPLVRIAHAQLNIPLEQIARIWSDHDARKKWDVNFCSDSKLIRTSESKAQIGYITGKSRYYYPSRDYVYHITRAPGAIVGVNDLLTTVFVNTDASKEVPLSSTSVRGNMNSLLYLKSINSTTTDVTYIVEYAINGWTTASLGEFVADNVVDTLTQIKKQLEVEPAPVLTPAEEVAAKRKKEEFVKERKRFDDVPKKDLQRIIDVLESNIADLQKLNNEERKNYLELETRLKDDVKYLQERMETLP